MSLNPVVPFEPIATDEIPHGDHWVYQIKWDGVRVLTYHDGDRLKLFNRRKNERTLHYPEVTNIKSYCTADSVILDGEIIALSSDGKPSFHEVMRRDGIRRMERVQQVKKRVPITYMIFDVLYFNGEWMTERSLKERMEMLSDIIIPGEHVQLVSAHDDGNTLFKVIQEHDMEGIVIKDLNSKYYINGKNGKWQKKKNYKDLIAVIGGVTLRDNIVNAVLLGLYDQKGQLWYAGHAGTGKLSQSEWRQLTERIKPLIINERPFVNKPDRTKDVIWLKPEITVKIQYAEWTEGHSLRQPSIQSFVDVSPDQCISYTCRKYKPT